LKIKNNFVLEVPILFLVFNRIHTTKKVFAQIQKIRPPKLYIASDGPRLNYPNEAQDIEEIRTFLLKNIDWDCEVYTRLNETNLGCKLSVSQSIDWFFENEEMGIILEDDCLPSMSFFQFCQELLIKYKDDKRIFLITGYNKQNEWKKNKQDYFFSYLGGIWGWASWRRAWKYYDVNIADIDSFISEDGFTKSLGHSLGKLKQNMIYNNVIRDNVDTWAMQWGYARHKNSALTCIPAVSLIKNIGFGENATHTYGDNLDGVEANEMDFPIRENSFVVSDNSYDELLFKKPDLRSRVLNKLRKFKSNKAESKNN